MQYKKIRSEFNTAWNLGHCKFLNGIQGRALANLLFSANLKPFQGVRHSISKNATILPRQQTPLYRSKHWKKQESYEEKLRKKRHRYQQGRFDSMMFVDSTSGGELMKTFKTVVREVELTIRILE